MTDNEIIKALECCASVEDGCPTDCPLFVGDDSCFSTLLKPTLNLINRQKAEIENLNKDLADTIALNHEERKRLKAEIERLQPFKDKIAEFNSHIRVENMLVFASSLDEWLDFCDNLKAEAIKEFAERLNKEAEKVGIDREGDFVEYNDKIHDTIADWCKETSDNLVKEMVGDA